MMTHSHVLAALESWLTSYLATRLGMEPSQIDTHQVFTDYGLASIEALQLMRDLEHWLDCSLSPTLAWNYPTIAGLAQYLASDPDISQKASLVISAAPASSTMEATFEPIAIIGMGCRFPGAPDLAAFWQLLCDGRDAITDVPPERWDINTLFDPDPSKPGKTTSRQGGFLEEIDKFDAQFFGISPREAPHVDPRQRLVLEVAWEAIEDAGISVEALAGSPTGVFVATLNDDYDQLLYSDLKRVDAYSGPGTANSIISNRVSYFLDLHGPSLSLDTACSGSLVSIHLACQSLRQGECTLALAGGVSINLLPKGQVFFSKAGALSPDGRCRTFSDQANGMVRSEGVGVVVLKPLAQAQADGDRIYAVILGSAVNQDGRSNGLMAPNGQAQEAVLREAYRRAGIAPGQVQYVEAHGTGTKLGDPIEVQALGAVLTENRPPDRICALGSLKTNLGHMEPAAGVAGVIKTALSIRYRLLPASLHCQEPNPLIPFGSLPFAVQKSTGRWPSDSELLIAGVSAFGFGGTNAHLVLAEAPQPVVGREPAPGTTEAEVCLLPLAARNTQALKDMADVYRRFLTKPTWPSAFRDICYSASVRRTHHQEHRLALVARSKAEATEHLAAFLRDEINPRLATGGQMPGKPRKLVFVFSGQGSHWAHMGCELAGQEPVFRATLEECDRLLRQHVAWSLLEELAQDDAESRLSETDRAQPAIFAIQVALAALWRSWGVEPDIVVGQSLGEVAAAYVAGALDLDDALCVVAHRSRLMKRTEGQGKTAVVGLPLEQAQLAIAEYAPSLSVAGSNSPTSSVLAGDPAVLETVLNALEKQGIFCRLLPGVAVAFHSPQMDPLQRELGEALADIEPRPGSIPIYSTVSGELIAGRDLGAAYWVRNLREPFLFSLVIQKLVQGGYNAFLEVSPHPVLARAVQDGLAHLGQEGYVWSSLRKKELERETLLSSLGACYAAGYPVDWARLYPKGGHLVSLPPYPWQRERYWLDQLDTAQATASFAFSGRKGSHSYPLLGERTQLAAAPHQHVWEMDLNAHSLHYLEDHRVQGTVVLPGAAYAEIALSAAAQVLAPPLVIEQVAFKHPLVLPETGWRRVQLLLCPHDLGEASFQFFSRDANNQEWVEHASGKVRYGQGLALPTSEAIETIKARCPEEMPADIHYQSMAARGLQYGASFRLITQIWRCDGEALARVELPDYLVAELKGYQIHPALLDAGFQAVAAAYASPERREQRAEDDTYLPVGVGRLQVFAPFEKQVWCHVRRRPAMLPGSKARSADIYFLDPAGQLIAAVEGLQLEQVGGASNSRGRNPCDWLYTTEWQSKALPAESAELTGNWLILADQSGLGQELAARLEAMGGRCTVAFAGKADVALPASKVCALDPADAGAWQRLLEDLQQGDQVCRGIIDLWGLDLPSPEAPADAFLAGIYASGCRPVLYLMQAMVQMKWRARPKLWLVTCGAQAVTLTAHVEQAFQPASAARQEPRPPKVEQAFQSAFAARQEPRPPVACAQAPLWGMGRVIAQEHPEFWGGTVDLEPGVAEENSAHLLEICRRSTGEDAFAVRGGQYYVPRLMRQPNALEQKGSLPLRADGSYLISGGLGGLGLEAAQWLVAQGARRLILMGRTRVPPRSEWDGVAEGTPDAGRIAALRRLEKAGATVYLAAADVADQEQVAAFLQEYDRSGWPPIRGVIHAAGILQDRLVLNMTAEALEAVLRPKVLGAWVLHRLLADMPLDFLVLFSSAAALLGQVGQANYAAGNAFMDALAHYRHDLNLPATSVNWGPWSGMGMAARLQEQFERSGMYALPPDSALALLGQLMARGAVQAAVISADWPKLQRSANGPLPLLDLLSQEATTQPATGAYQAQGRSAEQLLLITDPLEQRAALESYLRELVARVLRIGDPARLPADQPLTALGFDSIMAVELKNRIEAGLPITLSIADLVMGPSVAQLADRLRAQLETDPDIADLLEQIENMPLEDVE